MGKVAFERAAIFRTLFMLRERHTSLRARALCWQLRCRRCAPLVHDRPSLCGRVLSIASADLEAVLYRVEGMPGMAW